MNIELKPCACCGQIPRLFGRETRDYVNGKWSEYTRKYFWAQPFCYPSCEVGNMYSKKYGAIGGPSRNSEKEAIEYWNSTFGKED